MLPSPSKLAVRVLVATVLVLCGLYTIERPIGALLVTVFQSEVEMLAPAFTIRSSSNTLEGATQEIHFAAYLSGRVHLQGHVLAPVLAPGAVPRSALEISLPFSDVFKYCPLVLILVLAWPARGIKELLLRCAVALPLVLALLLIDVPSVVLANIWNEVRNEVGVHGVSGWVLFRRCLSGGGGLVLGGFMAGVSIAVAKRFTAERRSITSLPQGRVPMCAIADLPSSPAPLSYRLPPLYLYDGQPSGAGYTISMTAVLGADKTAPHNNLREGEKLTQAIVPISPAAASTENN